MNREFRIAVASLFLCATSVAQGATGAAQNYASYCADCHGARLEGAQAPALFGDRWMQDSGAVELRARIHDGAPSKGMPQWGSILSAADIDALVAFIRTRTAERVAAGSDAKAGPQVFETYHHKVGVESVLESGLDQPKSLALFDADTLLVTDSKGLRIVKGGVLASEPVAGLPTFDTLEEIAIHRSGAAGASGRDWLYVTYVCSKACGHPERHAYTLARGRLLAGRWVEHQKLVDFGDGDHVYGVSKLAFDDTGYLYFTLSGADHPGQDPKDLDREIVKAQDLGSHRGKTFRVHDDGRVPKDNPFVGRSGALPAIWSYGHRGLSGLYFDNATRTLWATEHGPWGGDELNRIVRGGNFGWPVVSFGYHYAGKPIAASQAPGLQSPVFHWTPSVGVSTVQVYDGAAFPKWRGNLLVGSLGARIGHTLYRFELDDGRALLYRYASDAQGHVLRDDKGAALPRVPRYEEIAPDIGRIRDTRIGRDGFVYLLLEHPDRIVRLVARP